MTRPQRAQRSQRLRGEVDEGSHVPQQEEGGPRHSDVAEHVGKPRAGSGGVTGLPWTAGGCECGAREPVSRFTRAGRARAHDRDAGVRPCPPRGHGPPSLHRDVGVAGNNGNAGAGGKSM